MKEQNKNEKKKKKNVQSYTRYMAASTDHGPRRLRIECEAKVKEMRRYLFFSHV